MLRSRRGNRLGRRAYSKSGELNSQLTTELTNIYNKYRKDVWECCLVAVEGDWRGVRTVQVASSTVISLPSWLTYTMSIELTFENVAVRHSCRGNWLGGVHTFDLMRPTSSGSLTYVWDRNWTRRSCVRSNGVHAEILKSQLSIKFTISNWHWAGVWEVWYTMAACAESRCARGRECVWGSGCGCVNTSECECAWVCVCVCVWGCVDTYIFGARTHVEFLKSVLFSNLTQ